MQTGRDSTGAYKSVRYKGGDQMLSSVACFYAAYRQSNPKNAQVSKNFSSSELLNSKNVAKFALKLQEVSMIS
jgi:hypothetical protein